MSHQGGSLTSEMAFCLHQHPELRPCDHLMTSPSLSLTSADWLGSSPSDRVSESLPQHTSRTVLVEVKNEMTLGKELTSQLQWPNYGKTF